MLRTECLTKSFPGVLALDGVDFAIGSGQTVALLGENGAGKSTLVKVLAGEHPANTYDGAVFIDNVAIAFSRPHDAGEAGIAYIPQEVSALPELSVAENLLLGHLPRRAGVFIDRKAMHRKAVELCELVGLDVEPNRAARELSTGSQQLLMIARAMIRRPRLLILDEPTSALSRHEVARLHDVVRSLQSDGVASIYISHRMDEVYAIADRIVVLRNGRMVLDSTPTDATPGAVVRAMIGDTKHRKVTIGKPDIGERVLNVEGLTVVDPRVRDRKLVDGLSFMARRGEIVGLVGLLGSGRSETLMALYGGLKSAGKVEFEGRPVPRTTWGSTRCGIGMVSEDRRASGLILDVDAVRNVTLASLRRLRRGPFIDLRREQIEGNAVLDRLQLRGRRDVPVAMLSGGNQQKVVLGKWLMHDTRLLLLDEPTRGIDVGAKREVHSLVRDLALQGMTVIVVSSEVEELVGLCDRFLVLRHGRKVGELSGDASVVELMDLSTGA